jgi:hypothetical protein
MKKLEFLVLGQESNSWVVQVPGRKYPGVVLQGDSLKNLYDLATEIVDSTPRSEGTHELASELCQLLKSHLTGYEKALGKYGIALPYSSSVSSGPHGPPSN